MKSGTTKPSAERVVKDIRRQTRRLHSAEEKIRIVLEGLRGEDSIAELCRREGIAQSLYYSWSKEFLEAGKKRLAGDTARQATGSEVKDLRAEARKICLPDTEIIGVSAEFGVPYIATRSEMAIAGYALLETLARHHRGFDAVIIGAFCHSFVPAAKELMPVPVLGIAEAAMRTAQLFGRRISIIGIGAPERGANEEIVSELNMTADMASIRILEMSGSALASNQEAAEKDVIRLGRAAVMEEHADVLVLGGSAFSGMVKRIQIAPAGSSDLANQSCGQIERNGSFIRMDKANLRNFQRAR